MATRSAHTAWTGGLMDGSGQVELTSSHSGTFDVTFPKRIADDADGTSPEELIAAAHSSCFAMQLSAVLAEAGGTPVSLEVTADVTVKPDPAGGLRITNSHLTVVGEVGGLDAAGFTAAAQNASETCPVSKALTGLEVTVDASLKADPRMHRQLVAGLVVALAFCLLGPTPVSHVAAAADSRATADLPPAKYWRKDVRRAMAGSGRYLHARLDRAEPGQLLAINFDIDNTTLATHYNEGEPVRRVLRFAKHAQRHGVYILFNTGRSPEKLADVPAQLAAAGYLVTEICTRPDGVRLVKGKRQCRRHFRDEGYTIIANVGNRRTDFVGKNYGRAFKLPNYHNRLG